MKRSKFSEAQIAFILRQGDEEYGGRRDLPQGHHLPTRSRSLAGGVGCSVETGSEAGKVSLRASSSAFS